jgi:aconitate hydratase
MPDTLVGTDSHTTMINGLGVLGWGVGGIEAEAAMLGQPVFLPSPFVVGVRVSGALPLGTTATDLVLTLTQMLRAHGVVGSFVEFFGAGLSTLELADRATLSNMCPEYGATAALFPVDDDDPIPAVHRARGPRRPRRSLHQGRGCSAATTTRAGLQRDPRPRPVLGRALGGGPKRPQDWSARSADRRILAEPSPAGRPAGPKAWPGAVVIAAITSCTNTSNPSVMVAAGLLAKKAVEAGLETKQWVKTSLAPGSRVVTDYLDAAGLQPYLDKLGFSLVGFGCTTCIGNSGPLPDEVSRAVTEGDLAVVAVLSGNRNFEGRIHPLVQASYLASPPLCVAYAIAGRVGIDLTREPLGHDADGAPVYLHDVWPSVAEVREAIATSINPEQFKREYGRIFDADEHWRAPIAGGRDARRDPESTYVRSRPSSSLDAAAAAADVVGARCLVKVGDSITTDHISPAGSIKPDSPAGRYLLEHGVEQRDFNSYGARRGNHEVMMRGTFANVRLRNELAPGTEGPWTTLLPDGEVVEIFEASLRYRERGVPLVVLAGKEYGSGSSRDWAAKGPSLLGIRAVIAESFERIHRSNLVGMGVLPLQYRPGQTSATLGLSGTEAFDIRGLADGPSSGGEVEVVARTADGSETRFEAIVRIDGAAELDYYRQGGILQMVLRQKLSPDGDLPACGPGLFFGSARRCLLRRRSESASAAAQDRASGSRSLVRRSEARPGRPEMGLTIGPIRIRILSHTGQGAGMDAPATLTFGPRMHRKRESGATTPLLVGTIANLGCGLRRVGHRIGMGYRDADYVGMCPPLVRSPTRTSPSGSPSSSCCEYRQVRVAPSRCDADRDAPLPDPTGAREAPGGSGDQRDRAGHGRG